MKQSLILALIAFVSTAATLSLCPERIAAGARDQPATAAPTGPVAAGSPRE